MVTHDQAEAMTLADRIVVFHDRRIQQVAAPMEIYLRPANRFVAQFVGSPAMTMLPVELADGGEHAAVMLGDGTRIETRVPRAGLPQSGALELGLRPEHVRVARGRRSPPRKWCWSSAWASAASSMPSSPTAAPSPARMSAPVPSRPATASRSRSTAQSAHLFGPDGSGFHRAAE